MKKACVVCGGDFEARGKVCSAHCREEKQRRLSRESARRRYPINSEKRRAEARAWKAANRQRVKEYQRKWLTQNQDRTRATSKAWRMANRDRVRELRRIWESRHREKIRAYHKRASDAWRVRNPNYNKEHYQRNAEARRQYSREWKRAAVDAHKVVCQLQVEGLRALFKAAEKTNRPKSKPRVRVRARDARARESERRHAAKRYAALQIVREILSKGPEALL